MDVVVFARKSTKARKNMNAESARALERACCNAPCSCGFGVPHAPQRELYHITPHHSWHTIEFSIAVKRLKESLVIDQHWEHAHTV